MLPWSNEELETILKSVISHGSEMAKIDFKLEIETNTPEQKSELLKDIIAIANTYDDNYEDYGFIIYGVKANNIIGIEKTETDTDNFQNKIEQLLKTYISPMPQIYVIGFENEGGKRWGAIAIPPRNNKPHMFSREFTCTINPKQSRKRGEWFVRHGSTTDPGLPEDLTLINQKQTDLLLKPLRESIQELQLRITKTEEQYDSALFKLLERCTTGTTEQEPVHTEISQVLGMDLSSRLKQKLRTPEDSMIKDIIAESKSLRDFLDRADTEIPWAPQPYDSEKSKAIIASMEEKTKTLLVSAAIIVLNDKKGIYTDGLLRAIRILAKTTEAPSGVSYNRIGESLRYYPLSLVLYAIFICGVSANRPALLKQVLEIPLKSRRGNSESHITDIFNYEYDARLLFKDALAERLCEPMAHRARQIIGDQIGDMLIEFSEPEYFFRGEFVLALAGIDKAIIDGEEAESRMPLAGLYLYLHEAEEPISEFLRENPDWFCNVYTSPMKDILDAFDKNAYRMAESGCMAIGMRGIKTAEIYQEAMRSKTKNNI